jgi:hypothetical protein
MRKYSYLILAIAILMSACTTQQITQALNDYMGDEKPTTYEVSSGLKEALVQGITKGANSASSTDGYFGNSLIRIPFPPEVQKVENTLRDIGLGSEVDKFVLTLNRGAEEAAKQAKPIFVNAIKQLTIQDAWNLLSGEEDAATQFLERTTTAELRSKFKPVMKSALDQTSATKYYGDLVGQYNKIPFVEDVSPNLDDYATDKALEGLFTLIRQEEANIRKNPAARATELLKKVFGYEG